MTASFDGNPPGLSAFDAMTASPLTTVDGVLLHGHDEVPDSLLAVAERWRHHHGLVLARPAAPLLSDEAGVGRAWWKADEEGPHAQTVTELLDLLSPAQSPAQSPALSPARPVLIAGFSQGAALAAALAAAAVRERGMRRLRVVLVAGFVPEPLDVPAAPESADLRMLVISGDDDSVVDPFHGELLARRFRRRGWTVAERNHPGGHQWDDVVTDLVSGWLTDQAQPGHRTS
ncbi:MAG: alpha/beta hydrolase [Acidimicrobiales bacterium]